MTASAADPNQRRVIAFAPVGRDGALTADLLERGGLSCTVCESSAALVEALAQGAALVVLTEESLDAPGFGEFMAALEAQPPWSDIPILVFAGGERADTSVRTIRMVESLRNVTIIERPIRVAAVLSLVRAAVRARQRQYETRDLLVALQEARNEAEAASRSKDEFLATLSHELRTPLNAILGWTMMLRHGQVPAERVMAALDVVDRNARAQAQLIEDVLDVARVITGKLRLELAPVDLPTLVATVVDGVRPAADAKNLHIVLDTPPDVPLIEGDAARLQQVIWNLVSNAVKFTPRDGELRLAIAVEGPEVSVSVTDSGVGMAAGFVPFAFDRFRQADQSVTRTYGGLGLGLAIVRHLVELHGGRVSAASRGEGQGATFTVVLPIPAVVPSRSMPGVEEPAPASPFNIRLVGRTVLVIDDDESTRELLRDLIGRAGARVIVTGSVAAALAALQQRWPDLIIADIGLPGEDGLSLMRRVRAMDQRAAAVPAIALSAYTRPEDRQAAEDAGFSRFIAKPAAPQDVLLALQSLLGPASSVR